MSPLLALKLLLVPSFLLLVSLAGRRWGPVVAGWLAGLPVVAGPILYLLALEQGPAFAAGAASSALAAVLASVSFSLAYAHCSQRARWPVALLAGLAAWLSAAWLLAAVVGSVLASALVALATLLAAPRLFPRVNGYTNSRPIERPEMGLRMLAGATLTFGVTLLADTVGAKWSGLLAVFPVLGIVLAVFSHRAQGAQFSAALLRAMATGLYSFFAFCLVLAVALPQLSVALAFLAAVGASLAVQISSRWLLGRSMERQAPAALEPAAGAER